MIVLNEFNINYSLNSNFLFTAHKGKNLYARYYREWSQLENCKLVHTPLKDCVVR